MMAMANPAWLVLTFNQSYQLDALPTTWGIIFSRSTKGDSRLRKEGIISPIRARALLALLRGAG